MIEHEGDEPAPDEPVGEDAAITPGREPSALERGARIFERLSRRTPPRPDDPDVN